MTVLDQMKILIQKAHEETKKHGKLLTDEQLTDQKEAHEHGVISNEIEGIYFTEEEEELFQLMHEARLPAKVQTEIVKKYCEITLGIKMD